MALREQFPDADFSTFMNDGIDRFDPRYPNNPLHDVSSSTTVTMKDGLYTLEMRLSEPGVVEIPMFLAQGVSGRGNAIWTKTEEALRQAGIREVQLHASSSVGPYFWARQGFKYDHRVTPSSSGTSRFGEGTGLAGPKAARTATSRFNKFIKLNDIGSPPGGWPTFTSPGDFVRALGVENAKKFFTSPTSRGGHGDWTGYKEI